VDRSLKSSRPPQTLPYNQSIDIWSLAAVLFHLISGKPPYVGSSEGKGARMLANIMTTPLDIGPLKECGVSHNCINLIAKMLNPDPLLRPDELECLRHPWLVDSASAGEMGLDDNNVGLGEIQEEDDLGLGASRQNESDDACDVADSNVSEIIEVDEIDHEDPRQSKRARIDGAFAPRDQAQLSSSPEVLYPSLPAIDTQQSTEIHTGSAAYNTRLFGEIGASALRSSGVLGYDAQAALQISTHVLALPIQAIIFELQLHVTSTNVRLLTTIWVNINCNIHTHFHYQTPKPDQLQASLVLKLSLVNSTWPRPNPPNPHFRLQTLQRRQRPQRLESHRLSQGLQARSVLAKKPITKMQRQHLSVVTNSRTLLIV